MAAPKSKLNVAGSKAYLDRLKKKQKKRSWKRFFRPTGTEASLTELAKDRALDNEVNRADGYTGRIAKEERRRKGMK